MWQYIGRGFAAFTGRYDTIRNAGLALDLLIWRQFVRRPVRLRSKFQAEGHREDNATGILYAAASRPSVTRDVVH